MSLILIHKKKEQDEQQYVVAAQSLCIEELGRQLESVHEELKMEKQRLLVTMSLSHLTCNNRKGKSNTEY